MGGSGHRRRQAVRSLHLAHNECKVGKNSAKFHMDFAVREIKICLPGPSALAVVFPRKQQSRAEEVICWLSAKSRHRFHGECFINFISRLHPVKETSLKSETPLFNSETRNFFFSSHSRKPTRCVAAPHCFDRNFAKNRSRLG